MIIAVPTIATCSRKCSGSDPTDAVTTAGQWVNNRNPLKSTSATSGRVRNRQATRSGRGRRADPPHPRRDPRHEQRRRDERVEQVLDHVRRVPVPLGEVVDRPVRPDPQDGHPPEEQVADARRRDLPARRLVSPHGDAGRPRRPSRGRARRRGAGAAVGIATSGRPSTSISTIMYSVVAPTMPIRKNRRVAPVVVLQVHEVAEDHHELRDRARRISAVISRPPAIPE